jgi:hypothetical protein
MKQVFVFLATLLISVASVWAGDEINVSAQDQQSISVTIYNKNIALVKDRRKITVPKGMQTLAFREVSAKIKPETALLHAGELSVLEQNFEYDLLSPQSLLQKYIGREVTMVRRHPTTGEEQFVQAKVLSAGNGVVLRAGDRIETEVSGRLVYPDVPDTLRERPTLTMRVESTKDGARDVELSYLTGGLSWQADYVAELNAADDRLNLSGWVTLTNESGARYPQAQLQLVAGDVNVIQREVESRAMRKDAMALGMAPAPPPMAEESLFEYHLYTLGRPTTIGENQKKQVSLLQAAGVECRKEFLLKGQEHYYSSQVNEIGRKMKVGVFVELKNDKKSGLGLPIPGGIVRVYKKDGSGFLQFVGEDKVDHTPEKEVIRLHLGDAFDVTADKRQTNFKKISGFSPLQYVFESEYEIKLKNAKKEQVTVKIQEPLPGDWEILGESAGHTKESAHTASWMVAVPPMETVKLTYRVRVKY